MNKEKLVKEALEHMGIHTQKDLKDATERMMIDISIMAASQNVKERMTR